MNIKSFVSSRGAALMISIAGGASLWAASLVPADASTVFGQTNLVSDGAVPAVIIDPNLINPWGISEGPSTPFWVSDNGTGLASVYQVPGLGNTPVAPFPSPFPPQTNLVVTIPPASGMGTSAPTGQVFNSFLTSSPGSFQVGGSPAVFLFASEDGAITGWNPGLGTNAAIAPTNSPAGAVYKGLAIDNPTIDDPKGSLFAANFNSGMVEMYNSSFGLVKTFTDPTLPAGYAPFNVRVINGMLYVTFALQDAAKHDDVAGHGNGFVDVFDLKGNLLTHLISHGDLNSPWGLEIAPASFGPFAGDLLVGNFGDGMIDAYNATTGAFAGTLRGTDGNPLSITDLWGLTVGNGSGGGDVNTLYFTAGLVDEGDGLFGSLTPTAVPEPPIWAMLLIGFAGLGYAGYLRLSSSPAGSG